MPQHGQRMLCAIAALTLWPFPIAARADISPPQDVYELRARDPQQPVQPPERLLFPRWQEDRRASIYGWVDCGIGGNTLGSDFNGPVGLQDRNLQAMMNQLYLVGERLIDVDSDDWQWGARVDLLYGTDGWQTDALGLDAYPFDQFDNFGVPLRQLRRAPLGLEPLLRPRDAAALQRDRPWRFFGARRSLLLAARLRDCAGRGQLLLHAL